MENKEFYKQWGGAILSIVAIIGILGLYVQGDLWFQKPHFQIIHNDCKDYTNVFLGGGSDYNISINQSEIKKQMKDFFVNYTVENNPRQYKDIYCDFQAMPDHLQKPSLYCFATEVKCIKKNVTEMYFSAGAISINSPIQNISLGKISSNDLTIWLNSNAKCLDAYVKSIKAYCTAGLDLCSQGFKKDDVVCLRWQINNYTVIRQ